MSAGSASSLLPPPNQSERQLRLLIVDDEQTDRAVVRRYLRRAGIAATYDEAATAAETLAHVADNRYDCVFLDYYVPGAEGGMLLSQARQRAGGTLPVVILTGRGDEEIAVELMKAGAADYLPKSSLSPERLAASLRHAIELAREQEARMASERALRDSEERFRILANAIPQIVWMADATGSVYWYNDRWYAYTGTTLAETKGWGWQKLHHPDHVQRVMQHVRHHFEEGRAWEETFPLRGADGRYRWFLSRAVPQRDDTGKVRGWFGTNTDITDHLKVERKLRARERQERFLARLSQVVASSLDRGRVLDAIADALVPRVGDFCFFDVVNRDAVSRMGAKHANPAKAAAFERVLSLGPRDVHTVHPIARILRTARPQLKADVTPAWLERTLPDPALREALLALGIRSLIRVPILAGGEPLGVFTIGTSDSDRTLGVEALRLAQAVARRSAVAIRNATLYAELEDAVRLRDEVTAIVSHDLRNPQNTIAMATGLLLEASLDPAMQRRQLEIIQRCVRQMNHLIEDLVNFATAEAGTLVVVTRPEDVGAILREAYDEFLMLASERRIELRLDIANDLPPALADRDRTQQVVSNILANALKFTPRGGKVVLGAEPAGDMVQIRVSDTGIGIAPEALPHVFDRFWQAQRSGRASAGLGLAIARAIVQAHGGSIWVESVEGRGSVFRFTLPAAGSARTEHATPDIQV